MTKEQAQFADFFTAPAGQSEVDYLREAQDALDTSDRHQLDTYKRLQTRLVAALEAT